MTPQAARRVFLLLTVTRWFPVGLVVTVTTLLPIERGLSVAQVLTLASVSGFTVFFLELPTSGVADALGRKPVLVTAAVAQVVAAAIFSTAHGFWAFAASSMVMGVFRALDSGPLQAWFVDAVHRTHPGADVDRTLSRQSTVLGLAIALGALASGGLVWWDPIDAWSALTLPYVVYAGLSVLHLIAVIVLLRETPRRADALALGQDLPGQDGLGPHGAGLGVSGGTVPEGHVPGRRALGVAGAWREARRAPSVVAEGLRLAGRNPVLRGLLMVEAAWAVGMVVFETFMPIRMGEILGSTAQAGAIMGPVASVGWAVFAGGAALAGLASARFGVARSAMAARVLNGLGAVWMGLVAGPVALVGAYLVTYGLHGSGGPLYESLLHRVAAAGNRATVLSMASMLGFASYGLAGPALGWTAEVVSTPVAMVVGGAVSVLGVFGFVPAWRQEKQNKANGIVAVRV